MDFPERPGDRGRRGDSPMRLPRERADRERRPEREVDDMPPEDAPEVPTFVEPEGGAGGQDGDARSRVRDRSETLSRFLWALPPIAVAIAVVIVGGELFMAAMIALGWIGLVEFFRMAAPARPIQPVAFLAVAAMAVAAQYGDSFQIVLAAVALFPLMLGFAIARDRLEGIAASFAVTVFAIIWIGLPFAHAVLLRDLDHGGGLVIDVLIATFITDTFAYLGGRAFGDHALAPTISPNKTVEGLVTGIIAGTLAFWLAGLYQDWLSGTDALLMGLCIAVVAPMGDLFESALKRDLEIKDSGGLFGPHGGLLDRLDAVLFTIVAGYYVSLAIVL